MAWSRATSDSSRSIREGGHTVNVHCLIATGVNAAGYWEILGIGSWPRITEVRYPVRAMAIVRSRPDSGEPAGCAVRLDYGVPASGSGSVIKAAVFSPGFSDRDRSRLGGDLGGLRRLRYHRTSVPEGKSSTRPTSS